jgi:hypothetical protein
MKLTNHKGESNGIFRAATVIVFLVICIIFLCSSAAFSILYAYFNNQRSEAEEIRKWN